MTRLVVLALIAATGCRSIFGIEDTRVIDAQQFDAPIDAPPVNGCIGDDQSLAKICQMPTGAKTFSSQSVPLSTDDDTRCDVVLGDSASLGGSLCVILGTTITIDGAVVVVGSRPLVFAASDTITLGVDGVIDASSNVTRLGAGHDDTSCMRHDGNGDSGGGGGGAGGTFGGKGGNGGTGDTNDNHLPAGMALGGVSPAKVASISSVRGGCPGGEGGSGDPNGGLGGGGAGGHGGGAVYLIATKMLDLGGRIYASGEGGRVGVAMEHGGGGGGSGGTVALEAAMIVMHASAAIAANGGGGAGGISADPTSAQPGDDGTTTDPVSIAGGGQGDTSQGGGSGGAGSSSGSQNGNAGASAIAGAGGGGGGVGFVWARGTFQANGAVISPTPQLH